MNHNLPKECVYNPEATPPQPLENEDRLNEGRHFLNEFIQQHQTEHGDPWDSLVRERIGS